MNIDIKMLHGNEITKGADLIAQMRLIEFKNFPYLYAGTMDAERKYLSSYAKDKKSIFTLAYCDHELAGIATGIPLLSNANILPGVQELFEQHGLKPQDYYYVGELIVLDKYRNQHIGSNLLLAQSRYVQSLNYKSLCLMTVEREDNHPLKPENYHSTDRLWQKLGYTKTTMQMRFKWPTITADGSIMEMEHRLSFWIKQSILP